MEKKQFDDIRYLFDKMQTTEQFLDLMNAVKSMYLKTNEYSFKMSQLNYYSNPRARRNCYHEFTIPKKNGSSRTITAPSKQLKMVQTILNILLNAVVKPHEKAYGFVLGKSIVQNAQIHANKNYVYNIDLKDFFYSVDQARVWACLKLKPVNLKGDETNERDRIANMIAAICCKRILVERIDSDSGKIVKLHKNVLPQGAPTSPILTNLVCQKLDFLLDRLAQNYKVKYSRYADDITFSCNKNVFEKEGDFIKRVNKIISTQGFIINESKVRLQSVGYRQEVTGLTVNAGVNVSKSYIKEIRKWLYTWERYGYSRAVEYYCISMDKQNKDAKILENVLRGKLNFLSMVKGVDNSTYQSLLSRYLRLVDVSAENGTVKFVREEILPDGDLIDIIQDILGGDLSHAMQQYHA